MSRRKTPPLECYKNSLRFSIREQIDGLTESKVRLKTWRISAPIWELPQGMDPRDVVDFLLDVEFEPGQWSRLWFELEYVLLNRIDMTAVYDARCENY